MSLKTKIIIVIVALGGAYSAGRYSAPEIVRVETKTIEVEKKHEETKTDVSRDKDKETVVTETEKPDGTKEKVTKIVEKSTTNKTVDNKQATKTDTETDSKREEIRPSSKVTISALAGFRVTSLTDPPVYGASVTKPILGPITVGVFGFSNGLIGASCGFTF